MRRTLRTDTISGREIMNNNYNYHNRIPSNPIDDPIKVIRYSVKIPNVLIPIVW